MQGLAVTKIKQIADSFGAKDADGKLLQANGQIVKTTESETIRAALQGLAGCAGAAAGNASCTSGALGASASVALNLIVDALDKEKRIDTNRDGVADSYTLETQQARTALIATLTGALAAALNGDPGAAITGARLETERNSQSAGGRIIFRDPVGAGREDYAFINLGNIQRKKKEDPTGYAAVINQFKGTTAEREGKAAELIAISDAQFAAIGGKANAIARIEAGEKAGSIAFDADQLVGIRTSNPLLASKLASQSPAVRALVYADRAANAGGNIVGAAVNVVLGKVVSAEQALDFYLALESDEAGEFKGPVDSFLLARKQSVTKLAADIRANSEVEASKLRAQGKISEADNALVLGYGRASAVETVGNGVLDAAKLAGDYSTNPVRVAPQIATGLAVSLDAIFTDDKPVLQYAAEANAAVNDPDPRKRGTLYGSVTAKAALTVAGGATVVLRTGIFRKVAPGNVPSNLVPNGPPSPDVDRINRFLDVAPNKIAQLRGGLSNSQGKASGTVAVADVNIAGLPSEIAAHSGIDTAKNGFVGGGKESLPFTNELTNDNRLTARNIDAEYKVLDSIADRLGPSNNASGSVTIFVELPPCNSCGNVALNAFKLRYPNIQVQIRHNNGVRISPIRTPRPGG